METVVSRTDDDALAARASAVKLGYWKDDHLKYFVKEVERKAPVINRGTFVRTWAIDQIIHHFLSDASLTSDGGGQKKQIISLGAGSDTRSFNLIQKYKASGSPVPFIYHEFDFPHVCQRKALTITSKRTLKGLLEYGSSEPVVVDARKGSILGHSYALHPLDLKHLRQESQLPSGIDPSLETLIISEVCLIYMEVESADDILHWTTGFPDSIMLIYEPIRGDDAFGRMMIKNLAARGLELKTLEKYSTLESQSQRLRSALYPIARSCTMNDVFEKWTTNQERERIMKLEMLDEVEEWILLAEHYCIAIGLRGKSSTGPVSTYLT